MSNDEGLLTKIYFSLTAYVFNFSNSLSCLEEVLRRD